jgi:glycosyltransferase involved in cell wall biosynthesis
MTSVVIAAHNEGAVIDRCLGALTDGAVTVLNVVVAANGCSDDTAERARRHPVTVLELPEPGKAAALNAADRLATHFPVVYLDADIALTHDDVDRLVRAVESEPGRPAEVLAAAPRRVVDASRSSLLVRAYHRILDDHPAYRHALFGRGAIALSELGRSRFERFPELLADDLFLDSLFAADEKAVVEDVVSVVQPPRHTRALVRRLARVRRGNSQVRRSSAAAGARPVQGLGWLAAAVRQRPSSAPAAVAYVAITASAILVARWGRRSWGHDQNRLPLAPIREPA